MRYNHITHEERIKIEAWKAAGETNGDIARFLDRHVSTIGRELKKVTGIYNAQQAQRRCITVRRTANALHRKIVVGTPLATYIEKHIRTYWSPEQVAGRIKKDRPCTLSVYHETIYTYLYKTKPELKQFLRCRKGKYRRRYGTKIREKRREEGKKKRIDMRPKIVEKRSRIGDWEGDTIVGKEKTQHIATHVDRTSGFLLADKISHATAENTRKTIMRRFNKLPKKKRLTITYDNGIQFAEYEIIERDLTIDIYFAYPYHSWERPINENTNGLIRQFIPKQSLFKNISQRQINHYVNLINTRPRKRLGYRTPSEVFRGVAV